MCISDWGSPFEQVADYTGRTDIPVCPSGRCPCMACPTEATKPGRDRDRQGVRGEAQDTAQGIGAQIESSGNLSRCIPVEDDEMKNPSPPDPQAGLAGWILYDDSCGICRRWVPSWESTLRKRGLGVAPLQARWVTARLNLKGESLAGDIRLIFADGGHIQGADVYRYAMKRIWWTCPAYLFSVAPLTGRIFDWGYKTFAAHRHRISDACGFPGGER